MISVSVEFVQMIWISKFYYSAYSQESSNDPLGTDHFVDPQEVLQA